MSAEEAIEDTRKWLEKNETWDTALDGLHGPDIADAVLRRIERLLKGETD